MNWARPAERPFLKRVSEWGDRVAQTGSWVLTDFLTPRELFLLEQYQSNDSVVIARFGGNPYAERQRVLVMPGDWHPEPEDFQIVTICATPVERMAISHGSVLGSVLGTGLDRRKIGDIFVQNDKAYVFCQQEVSNFLFAEWRQIGRHAVSLEQITAAVEWEPPQFEKTIVSAASFRADAVLAQSCHWSRGQTQEAIARGHVSLNFSELTKPETDLAVGDVLSVRGFGRVQVLGLLGKSKKDRERIEIGVFRSQFTPQQSRS